MLLLALSITSVLCWPAVGRAQDRWILVQEDQQQRIYLDTTTIRPGLDSTVYLAWFRFIFKEPQQRRRLTFSTMMIRAEVACTDRRHRLHQTVFHDSLGVTVATEQSSVQQWTDLVPGSSGEIAMLEGCRWLASHTPGEPPNPAAA